MRKIVAIRKSGTWLIDSYTEQIHIDKSVSDAKMDVEVSRIIVANITSDYVMEWRDREATGKT